MCRNAFCVFNVLLIIERGKHKRMLKIIWMLSQDNENNRKQRYSMMIGWFRPFPLCKLTYNIFNNFWYSHDATINRLLLLRIKYYVLPILSWISQSNSHFSIIHETIETTVWKFVLWKLRSITFVFFEVYSISKQYQNWKCYRFSVCLYEINRWQRLVFLLFVLCPQTAYCVHIHGSINDAIKHRIISVIWCLKGHVALVK